MFLPSVLFLITLEAPALNTPFLKLARASQQDTLRPVSQTHDLGTSDGLLEDTIIQRTTVEQLTRSSGPETDTMIVQIISRGTEDDIEFGVVSEC